MRKVVLEINFIKIKKIDSVGNRLDDLDSEFWRTVGNPETTRAGGAALW
jgi:hypothetical protein